MRLLRNVPSLTALVALEAVIRHKSFTEAARELGVTQAAVSRQIACLEQDFGVSLFTRGHRSIQPTNACAALGVALAENFLGITEAVEAIRATGKEQVVTIGATVAFSTFWLLSRLIEFRRLHPEIQLRVISQDSKINMESSNVDVVIRYGNPPFDDGTVLASCGDTIVPVCSPEYATKIADKHFWEIGTDLIEYDAADSSWYSWPKWYTQMGVKKPSGEPSMKFSHYTETIAAAKAGQGVALGWGVLVNTFIQDGSLVGLSERTLVPDGLYNILVPLNSPRNGAGELAANWLISALQDSTNNQ